jgi:serine/threonine protein kinase/tetratricopeptide (TPR) repeat protein
MIGTTLLHYRIDSKVGEGGMGVVYKATDIRLGRSVAIKVLPTRFATDAIRLRRFAQESRTASSLNHPNIVTIYDIASLEDLECIVMEYVTGCTLADAIPPTGLPVETALDYGAQIASALAAAHAASILHRDLKPANVMVSESGLVKVLDFGLAKRISSPAGDDSAPIAHNIQGGHLQTTQSAAGLIVGTAAYMSPEQAQGQTVDARSDIFSFGTVLYEMLTGRRAFTGESLAATLSAVLRDEPPSVREINPRVSADIDNLVQHCLHKDPADRAPTMQSVASSLRGRSVAESTKSGASVAVLPFVNMSPDRENEFLSDGISEDLITALSRLRDLRVPARTSSFVFKGKNDDIRRIGQVLGVDTVLTGSVQKSGNRLRIAAQLVKVCDGFHLWSERYDREMKDVFDIQDDITRAIVNALQVQLGASPEVPLVKQPTRNPDAYQLFVKGREFFQQRGVGLKKALHYFELALLEDPRYALAHVGVADTHNLLGFYDEMPCREAFARAHASVARAQELDDQLAEVHVCLGWLTVMRDWNLLGAQRHYLRALELNPKCASARIWYAPCLLRLNQIDECMVQTRLAVEQEPMSPLYQLHLAWRHVDLGQCQAAVSVLRSCLEAAPHFAVAWWLLGQAHLRLGQVCEAVTELERGVELSHRWPKLIPMYVRALVMAGDQKRAEGLLRELQERNEPAPTRSFYLAETYAALGDRLQALACLNQALAEREMLLPWLRYHWLLLDLHGEAQFEELAQRVDDEISAIHRWEKENHRRADILSPGPSGRSVPLP